MAIMIPQAISKFDTDGERRVYDYLKDNLSAEYIVFYNLRSEITGLVDFIIVCPYGILGIEVKDWSAPYIKSCTADRVYLYNPSHPFEEHPVKVSQHRIWSLVNKQINPALGRFPGCYSGVAWYVNLTDIELEQRLCGGKRRTHNNTIQQLTSDDFDNKNAEELLSLCFEHRKNPYTRNLTNGECMAIKKFILQEKKIHVTFHDLVIELDKQQMEYAKHMEYGQYILRGAGGTGKTVRLVGRAIYLAEEHQDFDILFVTSKKDLVDFVAPNFQPYKNIFVRNKHQVLMEPDFVLASTKFDALLIDELQDFTQNQIEKIKSLLRVPNKSHFIGAIDGAQNTWNNQYNLSDIANKVELLTQNYRNGDRILSYIQSIGQTSSNKHSDSSNHYDYYNQTISHHKGQGEVFTIDLTPYRFETGCVSPRLVPTIIQIINTYHKLNYKEMGIIQIGYKGLLNSISQSIRDCGIPNEIDFSPEESIKLLNNTETKGLEFKLVILLIDKDVLRNYEQSKILAASRASQYLYVIDY